MDAGGSPAAGDQCQGVPVPGFPPEQGKHSLGRSAPCARWGAAPPEQIWDSNPSFPWRCCFSSASSCPSQGQSDTRRVGLSPELPLGFPSTFSLRFLLAKSSVVVIATSVRLSLWRQGLQGETIYCIRLPDKAKRGI